ncbi:MAG: phosphate ABC transporter permease [Cyanobacteria bacterium P01_H01_bin.15]
MLVPLTREAFERLLPLVATGPQYTHYWETVTATLRRALVSFIAVVALWLFEVIFLRGGSQTLFFILIVLAGLYWLWGPIYWASLRNANYRRYPFSGFWRGPIVDVFITEELIGEEQTVDEQGRLVIVENRERRINVEVADGRGFQAVVQAPLLRIHKSIRRGQVAELLVLSKDPDLERVSRVSDIYVPQLDLWVGDYPYVSRDEFIQVSNRIGNRPTSRARGSRRSGSSTKRKPKSATARETNRPPMRRPVARNSRSQNPSRSRER